MPAVWQTDSSECRHLVGVENRSILNTPPEVPRANWQPRKICRKKHIENSDCSTTPREPFSLHFPGVTTLPDGSAPSQMIRQAADDFLDAEPAILTGPLVG